MANKKYLVGILAMVLVFVMTAVGCDTGGDGDSGGYFVLTDIPAVHNGRYAMLETSNDFLFGLVSFNMNTEEIIAARISDGRVSIPMWMFSSDFSSMSKYSGNHTVGVIVFIYTDVTAEGAVGTLSFTFVTFSGGNAERAFSAGTWIAD